MKQEVPSSLQQLYGEQEYLQRATHPEIAQQATLQLSVVIVNYNTDDYLERCLLSLQKAVEGIDAEIIVIDNASPDRRWQRIQEKFPAVRWISLPHNVGFARANNIGFSIARGEYILCLNPDTIVEDKAIRSLIEFMEKDPRIGAAGPRILNPDGSLQLACRRSFPTPFVAFTRLTGLQKLFPKSKIFGRYNLTYLDENAVAEVDSLSGACMMIRRAALRQVRGFDPNFFMYGEDIDLCYRIKKNGWKIVYVPDAQVVHFKGVSTRRSRLDQTRVFYQAMEIFTRKHFSYYRWFYQIILLAIKFREFLTRIWKYRRPLMLALYDLAVLNGALFFATTIRFGSPFGFPEYAYPTVFLVLSLVVLLSLFFLGEYSLLEYPSVFRTFTGMMIAFFLLASLTYFFKDYAFSRGVLLMTIGVGTVLTTAVRALLFVRKSITDMHQSYRVAIVGTGKNAQQIAEKLLERHGHDTYFIGYVATNGAESSDSVPVVGDLTNLEQLIQEYRITEVIIAENSSPTDIVRLMREYSRYGVRFYLTNRYDDIEVEKIIQDVVGRQPEIWRIFLPRYIVAKRIIDLAFACFFLTIGFPVVNLLFGKDGVRNLLSVLRGKRAFVGVYEADDFGNFLIKPGVISLVHLQQKDRLTRSMIRKLNEYYAREYSVAFDFEILVRYIVRQLLWHRITKTP